MTRSGNLKSSIASASRLMSKVLFTHSYFLRFDPKQWKQQQPYAPLGTLYAAAVMREAGHAVRLHDTMFSSAAEDLIPVLEKENPDYLVIYDDGLTTSPKCVSPICG